MLFHNHAGYNGFHPIEFFHSFLPLTNFAASLRKAKKGHESTLLKMQQCVAQMMKEQECIQVRDDLREVELNIKYVKGVLVGTDTSRMCEQIADLERVVWKILDFVRGYFDQNLGDLEDFEFIDFLIACSRQLDSEKIIRIMCETRIDKGGLCININTGEDISQVTSRIARINLNFHEYVCRGSWSQGQDMRQRTLLQDHIMKREYKQALLLLKLGADPEMAVCSGILIPIPNSTFTRTEESVLPPLFLACVMYEEDRRAGKKLTRITELIIGLLNAGAKTDLRDAWGVRFVLVRLLNLNSCSDFFIPACELLISLMRNSDFIHARNWCGYSLLMHACELNVRPAIDYLLSKGVVVIQADIDEYRKECEFDAVREGANKKKAQEFEGIFNRLEEKPNELLRTLTQIDFHQFRDGCEKDAARKETNKMTLQELEAIRPRQKKQLEEQLKSIEPTGNFSLVTLQLINDYYQ